MKFTSGNSDDVLVENEHVLIIELRSKTFPSSINKDFSDQSITFHDGKKMFKVYFDNGTYQEKTLYSDKGQISTDEDRRFNEIRRRVYKVPIAEMKERNF